MIQYQVFTTRLRNEVSCVARVKAKETYDQQRLVDRMIEIGTSVSRDDIHSVLNLLRTTVAKLCSDGYIVSLDGFVRFAPAIGGTFNGELDGPQADRNPVYVNASVSSIFNDQFTKEVQLDRLSRSFQSPLLATVNDLATESSNSQVTPGNIVTITGERLKFDPLNTAEYLRFVSCESADQAVAITKFQRLTDRQVVFLMPQVGFAKGYFELASSMNTNKIRSDKSPLVEVAA